MKPGGQRGTAPSEAVWRGRVAARIPRGAGWRVRCARAPRRRAFARPIVLAVCLVAPAACDAGPAVPALTYEVHRTLPHDPGAYTQGLVLHDGAFLEGTGQYGSSELRRVDVATGQVQQSHALADDLFGEGIAVAGDRIIQLTWKTGRAFVYDVDSFAVLDTLEYEGEGWGLCHDGASLFQSDGSGTLLRRDPATFAVLEEVRVTRDGFSTRNLNELECVGDDIWANIYMSNEIVRIDKRSGEVTGVLDALSLVLASSRPTDAGAVLNGIAHDPATGRFYLTGKLWSEMFEVSIR